MFPLQVVDSFLLPYNVGQALLLLFIMTTLGALPLKSRRLLAINTIVFGLIFMLTPLAVVPYHYALFGIVLLVIAPMLYVTARQ